MISGPQPRSTGTAALCLVLELLCGTCAGRDAICDAVCADLALPAQLPTACGRLAAPISPRIADAALQLWPGVRVTPPRDIAVRRALALLLAHADEAFTRCVESSGGDVLTADGAVQTGPALHMHWSPYRLVAHLLLRHGAAVVLHNTNRITAALCRDWHARQWAWHPHLLRRVCAVTGVPVGACSWAVSALWICAVLDKRATVGGSSSDEWRSVQQAETQLCAAGVPKLTARAAVVAVTTERAGEPYGALWPCVWWLDYAIRRAPALLLPELAAAAPRQLLPPEPGTAPLYTRVIALQPAQQQQHSLHEQRPELAHVQLGSGGGDDALLVVQLEPGAHVVAPWLGHMAHVVCDEVLLRGVPLPRPGVHGDVTLSFCAVLPLMAYVRLALSAWALALNNVSTTNWTHELLALAALAYDVEPAAAVCVLYRVPPHECQQLQHAEHVGDAREKLARLLDCTVPLCYEGQWAHDVHDALRLLLPCASCQKYAPPLAPYDAWPSSVAVVPPAQQRVSRLAWAWHARQPLLQAAETRSRQYTASLWALDNCTTLIKALAVHAGVDVPRQVQAELCSGTDNGTGDAPMYINPFYVLPLPRWRCSHDSNPWQTLLAAYCDDVDRTLKRV